VVVHVIIVPTDHRSVCAAVRRHISFLHPLTIVLGNPPCKGSRSTFGSSWRRDRGLVLWLPF
jgi:hypothetical protein